MTPRTLMIVLCWAIVLDAAIGLAIYYAAR
jgi:hypothetical protein